MSDTRSLDEKRKFIIKILDWHKLFTKEIENELNSAESISVPDYLDRHLIPLITKLYKEKNDYGSKERQIGYINFQSKQFRDIILLYFHGDLSYKAWDKVLSCLTDAEKAFYSTITYGADNPLCIIAASAGNLAALKQLDKTYKQFVNQQHLERLPVMHFSLVKALSELPKEDKDYQKHLSCYQFILKMCVTHATLMKTNLSVKGFSNLQFNIKLDGNMWVYNGTTPLLEILSEICYALFNLPDYATQQSILAINTLSHFIRDQGGEEDFKQFMQIFSNKYKNKFADEAYQQYWAALESNEKFSPDNILIPDKIEINEIVQDSLVEDDRSEEIIYHGESKKHSLNNNMKSDHNDNTQTRLLIRDAFNTLEKQGIHLNVSERLITGGLTESILSHHEALNLNQDDCIKKLFTLLQENKYGTFKCIEKIWNDHQHVDPYGKAVELFFSAIGIAEYLVSDRDASGKQIDIPQKRISEYAKIYEDDLLFFSYLIAKVRTNNDDEALKQNLDTVKKLFAMATYNPALYEFFKKLIQANQHFDSNMVQVFQDILLHWSTNHLSAPDINNIYKKHYGFILPDLKPDTTLRDSDNLKSMMVSRIIMMSKKEIDKNELMEMEVSELWDGLSKINEKNREEYTAVMQPVFSRMQFYIIENLENEFNEPKKSAFSRLLVWHMKDLLNANNLNTVEKINEVNQLIRNFKLFMQSKDFINNEEQFTALFNTINFSSFVPQALNKLLANLMEMQQQSPEPIDYLPALEIFFNKKIQRIYYGNYRVFENINVIKLIRELNARQYSLAHIGKIIYLIQFDTNFYSCISTLIQRNIFDKDPVLKWILDNNSLSLHAKANIATMTQSYYCRDMLQKFLEKMQARNNLILPGFVNALGPNRKKDLAKVFEIIARCDALSSKNGEDCSDIDYAWLIGNLYNSRNVYNVLPDNVLIGNLQNHTISIRDLTDFLHKYERTDSEAKPQFIWDYMKEYFHGTGKKRKNLLEQQFAISTRQQTDVIRGINSQRLDESFEVRKHKSEAVLLADQMGHDLPMYRASHVVANKMGYGANAYANHAAVNLETSQIGLSLRSLGNDIVKKMSFFDALQAQQYALPLIREALYRITGEFPDHKQITSLIDWIMEGDKTIAADESITTKAMIATCLWLMNQNDKMNSVLMSIPMKDIEPYLPFFEMLDMKPDFDHRADYQIEVKDLSLKEKEASPVSSKEQTLDDLTPAAINAYNLLNRGYHPDGGVIEEDVTQKLTAIYESIGDEKKFQAANHAYLDYLNSRMTPMIMDVREIHQNAFIAFLEKHQRNKDLNTILSHPHFSQTAKLMNRFEGVGVNNTVITNCVKSSVTALLEEYSDYFWVGKDRRQVIIDLSLEINSKNKLSEIIQAIHKCKTDLTDTDVKINRDRFFGRNTLGSRLQTTLDNALSLIKSFTDEQVEDHYLDHLTKQLEEIVKKDDEKPAIHIPTDNVDHFEASLQSLEFTDKNNMKIIRKNIENVLTHSSAFFQKPGKEEIKPEDTDDKRFKQDI